MFNESRIDIYDYIYGLVYGVVTNNVYRMGEPVETTESDTTNGFVVINVGNMNDDSEFSCDAYGWVRCAIMAFVPKKSRGRLNKTLYKSFETSINQVVKNAMLAKDASYYISGDNVLSMDSDEITQKGNQYHVYIKSFVVVVDGEIEGENQGT
jgi:hypothetical protein